MAMQATDPDYLRNEQYRRPGNLDARAELHRRFSINKQGLHRWVFDQLELPDDCRILEVGCGPGWLWKNNHERIPAGWEVTLCDLSIGMVETAIGNTRIRSAIVADAQHLPFADKHFSAIIANHMLYHVPQKERALAAFQRILISGGRLYATTNGEDHLKEIFSLMARFDEHVHASRWVLDFTLESGSEILQPFFTLTQLRHFIDRLEVTEAKPLADFIASMIPIEQTQHRQLVNFIQGELDRGGTIPIQKDSGWFIASK